MIDRQIVEYCAPTLAGIKAGSLFRCAFENTDSLLTELFRLNDMLLDKGVEVTALEWRSNTALIYLYRPSQLDRYLRQDQVRAFLQKLGYETACRRSLLRRLRERVREAEEFPHEIGLFLGYPLGDVVGFIENRGRNCKSCGLWKVYCDPQSAEMTFKKFRKCTQVYCRKHREGVPLIKLTVAA